VQDRCTYVQMKAAGVIEREDPMRLAATRLTPVSCLRTRCAGPMPSAPRCSPTTLWAKP
jgi:hypothetical protein